MSVAEIEAIGKFIVVPICAAIAFAFVIWRASK